MNHLFGQDCSPLVLKSWFILGFCDKKRQFRSRLEKRALCATIISQNIFNFPIFDSIVECAPIESKCISNQKRASAHAYILIQNLNPSTHIFKILLFALQALSNRSETSRVGGGRTHREIYARARFLLADHQKWENRDARFECAKESGLLQNASAGQAEKPNL